MSNGFAKVAITATLVVETGLHIGTGGAFSAIGAVDSPVVRDPLSKRPMIPGSSLKGKMRSLLAKEFNEKPAKTANGDAERIKRLFGSSEPVRVARLIFRDAIMSADEEGRLRNLGAQKVTEIKYENTIDRLKAEANPRQIERVIRGSEFQFELVYEISAPTSGETVNEADAQQDIETLMTGLKLLTFDYLGGHGTRGYGRVSFKGLAAKTVAGDVNPAILTELSTSLAQVGS